MKRLFHCGVGTLSLHPLIAPRRHCATTPSEEDVLKAYKTLGVHTTASLADVKKRYGSLAKEHHPDVASSAASSSTNRMTDINTAYNTVKLFYQSGGRLSRPHASSNSGPSSSSSYGGPSSYYTQHDTAYQPWHEDMDPLMYELMWEEMRRQNEEENFANADGDFSRMNGGGWRPPRHNAAGGRGGKQRGPSPGHSGGGNDKANSQSQSNGSTTSTTTWPEEQVKAMVNMYQDGKSFEFIANALGKDNAAAVMEEFNRWSADSQSNRRRNNNNNHGGRGRGGNNNNRRRRPNNRPYDFYSAESPDDIPFELYEMMGEEPYFDGSAEEMGNPFGYYTGDGDSYEGHYGNATPFYGTHQMSGGMPPFPHGPHSNGGRGRVFNSNRNASFKPPRHHRGGAPHKAKRNNASHNGSGNSNNASKK